MLAQYPGLRQRRPAANAPLPPATIKRVGNHAVTLPAHGGAFTTVDGRIQHFHSFEDAHEFLSLYQDGNQDRTIPFACPGFSLVIYGSLVCRAEQWVKDDAIDAEIGDREYVWYFTFSQKYGTEFVMNQAYNQTIADLKRLIARESKDFSRLPF